MYARTIRHCFQESNASDQLVISVYDPLHVHMVGAKLCVRCSSAGLHGVLHVPGMFFQ